MVEYGLAKAETRVRFPPGAYMKKGLVLVLILLIAGCAAQDSKKVLVNFSCGPFKDAKFGEWVNATMPEGADLPKLTFEIYKQVQALSPSYFKYEFCDEKCRLGLEAKSIASMRVFECYAPNWKIRCAYDLEGWVCVNATN
jgi:hypothetical protein